MAEERVYRWVLNLRSGSAMVETTTEVLLHLAKFDDLLMIHPQLGKDGHYAPDATCAVCGRRLYFAVGWNHHREGNEPAKHHTNPDGSTFCDFVDHRAVPTFDKRPAPEAVR